MRHVQIARQFLTRYSNHHFLHQGVEKLVEFAIHGFRIWRRVDPHPPLFLVLRPVGLALRGATLSRWERDIFRSIPLPLGEGGAKRRVRVSFEPSQTFG